MTDFILAAIITIGVFVGIVYALTRTGSDDNMRGRLDRMAGDGSFDGGNPLSPDHNPETAFLEQDKEKSALAVFGESVIAMTGGNVKEKEKEMQLTFIQAGIYSPNAIGQFYAFRAIALPLAILLAYSLFTTPVEGMMKLGYYGAAIGVLFLSWFGPGIYISNTKQKRQKVLQRSFPDTLDLILVCVESGLALDAALARVCRELGRAHPEITKELNRTRMELTLLSDRSIALQNLAERTDLVAFRSLVAALLQTEKFGTSLTETLRVLSDDFRQTRLMTAENKAGRLPALMTIPMILLMMPAFVMIILGPGIIQAMKAFEGID
jgi:tight adherence protein C